MDDKIKNNLIAQERITKQLNKKTVILEDGAIKRDGSVRDLESRSEAIREKLKEMGRNLPEQVTMDVPSLRTEEIHPIEIVRTYEEVTARNIEYLTEEEALDIEFDSLFSPNDLLRIERELCGPIIREKWDKWDFVATFSAGIAGIIADSLTGNIDSKLKDWLGNIKINSPQVSIDYQGPAFSGPYHRVFSSGHDILRVFNAIWQIKNGTFIGLRQVKGGFKWIKSTNNQYGVPFDKFNGLEAFLIWIRHILSDFVTEKSIPVPGMSWLIEMPNHEIRKFAIQLYQHGYNLRFLLVQALAPALVEIVVRGYLMGREFKTAGEIKFPSAKRLKTTEMLLMSHALVMAVNAGKVVVKCNAEGPLALRNLNIPSIVMTVRYFIPFICKRIKLNDPVEILIRNARELNQGYDKLLAGLKADLEHDKEFQDFLHDENKIVI